MLTQGVAAEILLILSVMFCVVLIFFVFRYRMLLDNKNTQLIQSYMGQHFTHKNLLESLGSSNARLFCANLMIQIKEYYNLQDIILIESVKNLPNNSKSILHDDIIEIVKNNLTEIMSKLPDNRLIFLEEEYQDELYRLSITKFISSSGQNGLIICIENNYNLWTKPEKESLATQLNILKHRLS